MTVAGVTAPVATSSADVFVLGAGSSSSSTTGSAMAGSTAAVVMANGGGRGASGMWVGVVALLVGGVMGW